jgi:hypothetical protein
VKQFSVFNPLSLRVDLVSFMRIGPETLVLNGQPQTVTKVVTFIGGTPLHGWWDQEGRILKEEAAPGLVLLRESRDEAISGDWQEHAMQVPVSTVKVDNSAKE